MVGESPVAWRIREQVAFAAKASAHVLLLGESGTGKELAARAVHALSPREDGPFVARNAATLPAGLIDAELFGNAKNYPNPGMAERAGLIGQANKGTLFLDEIGELPAELQAHLLRVLDTDGEYQRLGESQTRRSELRLVGATNRAPEHLQHDVLARFAVRVELPPLLARREDIPLFIRHVLLRAARKSPEVAGRFVTKTAGGAPQPQVDPALVEYFLRAPLQANARDIEAILWRAMSESAGDVVRLPQGLVTNEASPRGRLSRPGSSGITQIPSA
jgi:two-component system nitrogen regulation response regulator GlnG/two-component system response regulator HydG